MHTLPVVVEFLRAHPDIQIRVELNDRRVDLLEEHVDLALRLGKLPDSSMIATRVGLSRPVVCASPAYLKIRGVPKKPADLASHECITYQGHYNTRNNWEFHTKGTSQAILVPSRLAVSSADAAVAAAAADAGIARVFSFQIVDLVKAGSLVTLLEAYEPSPAPVNLIYPAQRQVPLKLRAFLDFAIPRLRDRLDYKSP
jgi:DNA-binding transcriptional LysR family regulator